MSSSSAINDIPGGSSLIEWFGRVHRFHDAVLLEMNFPGKGIVSLRIHAWNMTDEIDAKGYFILEKHAVVTLTLEGVSAINCTDFDMVPAIIFDLDIAKSDEGIRVAWSASFGVEGSLVARHARLDLIPGKPR